MNTTRQCKNRLLHSPPTGAADALIRPLPSKSSGNRCRGCLLERFLAATYAYSSDMGQPGRRSRPIGLLLLAGRTRG
ncbi:unnamed protein product [Penicillium nalgiovense]|nr:unnamed protein product [Penicillium nalgiovense]